MLLILVWLQQEPCWFCLPYPVPLVPVGLWCYLRTFVEVLLQEWGALRFHRNLPVRVVTAPRSDSPASAFTAKPSSTPLNVNILVLLNLKGNLPGKTLLGSLPEILWRLWRAISSMRTLVWAQSSYGTPLAREGLWLGRYRTKSLCCCPCQEISMLLFLLLGSTEGLLLGCSVVSCGLWQVHGMLQVLQQGLLCVSSGCRTCWAQYSCQAGVLLLKLLLKKVRALWKCKYLGFLFYFSWPYKLLYQKMLESDIWSRAIDHCMVMKDQYENLVVGNLFDIIIRQLLCNQSILD